MEEGIELYNDRSSQFDIVKGIFILFMDICVLVLFVFLINILAIDIGYIDRRKFVDNLAC